MRPLIKGCGPVVALILYSFMVTFTKRFILSLALRFGLVFFNPFRIAVASLVEERAGLCTFVRLFVLRVSFLSLWMSGIDCDFKL